MELNRNVLSTLSDSGKRGKRKAYHHIPLFLPLLLSCRKGDRKNITQFALAIELQVFSPVYMTDL
jgi:hypothetical protein